MRKEETTRLKIFPSHCPLQGRNIQYNMHIAYPSQQHHITTVLVFQASISTLNQTVLRQ